MPLSNLPKEKQTAYQRWELASFAEDHPPQEPPPPSKESIAELNAQLTMIREESRRAGYADGIAGGIAEGRNLGRAEGSARAAEELLHLRQISAAFANEMARANEVIAEDLLMLALDIAKAMLKTALEVKPELVLPIVGEAVRYLPSLQQPALLFLHPEDAILVRQHMEHELAEAGWRVTEDMHLERGGCRIETASNQIDASMTSRWERVAASLGMESSWLQK